MRKLFWLIVTILITTNCYTAYAEDEQKSQIYVLNDFSGGLNSKTSEFSLEKKQGTVCNNVRFNTELGSVAKRSAVNLFGTASTDPILGLHRFYKSDGTKVLLCNSSNKVMKYNDSTGLFSTILTVGTGDHRWQWETWHDIAIGTDGYNQPVKYDGTSASATYLGSCLAVDAGSGAGPNGTYSYKVAFYTATYTVLFNVPSNSVTVVDNDITLTMIPIAPDTFLGEAIVGRKVYRPVTGGTAYKLLSNGTIADNSTVTIVDSDADGALGAAMPTVNNTTIFEDTVPKARFLIVHKNRLFFANEPSSNNSRVWNSSLGLHDYFASDSYNDIRQNDGDEITFIKSVLGVLTIGKNNSIQKLYTDSTEDEWSLSDVFSRVGCQAPYSAYNTPRGLFYLGVDGIYNFSGQYTELVSEVVTPEIQDIDPTDLENCWGIYHNSMYYLAYPSSRIGLSTNNRVLILDMLSNAYSIDLLDVNCFSAFNSGTDFGILYFGSSTDGTIYSLAEEISEIIHRRHGDFDGLWDDMRYVPTTVGGSSESPVLEIAWTKTIDEMTGTINTYTTQTIDRPDTNGHYVSQPINTLDATYDKLYWSETIPSGGGDVTFQLRTSPTGEKNLLKNDDFELWDNNPTLQPNDWTGASTSTTVIACASDTTTVKRGTYAVKVATEATISQVMYNASAYAGQTLTFQAWVDNNSGTYQKTYIEIGDGYATTRSYYPVSAAYQATSATLTLNATATTVTLKCAVLSGSNQSAYFDQVMLARGSSVTNDWTAWSSELTNSSGDDISGITADDYLQYQINMTTTDITQTPNIIKSDNQCVRITYDKAGSMVTTDIPMQWTSGWTDFNQPGFTKVLRKLYVLHEGTAGTVTITFTNLQGETDTFEIDLSVYPESYTEYFTTGALIGEFFKVDITSDDDDMVNIKRIIVMYDTNPLV